MSTKYLTCADTAKLVRQALKEAFPGVRFSVRGKTYSGGASLRVEWLDGPNVAQVEAVACHFEASYFDASIDYRGSIRHMMDGQQVQLGADSINCTREYSDAAVQAAIDRVFRRYAGDFSEAGIGKPTVEQWRTGKLWDVHLPSLHQFGNQSVMADVNAALYKNSDRMKVEHSKTAARVFVSHDDGYSRACGAGISAVTIEA